RSSPTGPAAGTTDRKDAATGFVSHRCPPAEAARKHGRVRHDLGGRRRKATGIWQRWEAYRVLSTGIRAAIPATAKEDPVSGHPGWCPCSPVYLLAAWQALGLPFH